MMNFFKKKGEIGVGALIVFIAMLIVASTAAGVLIMTATSLQEDSLLTGKQVNTQISTNVQTTLVSGSDGTDGIMDDIYSIIKLSSGSDPIKLDDVLYYEGTKDTTNNMNIKKNGECINDVFTGYFTIRDYSWGVQSGKFNDFISDKFTFSSSQTSEMMIGKIGVTIIFVESNGAVDTNFENWTTVEENIIINATMDAFDWFSEIERRAHIRPAFKIYRNVPTSYEPITRDTSVASQTLWMTEALDYIGAPSGASIFQRIRALNNDLRREYNTHWAFTFFVVDSSDSVAKDFGGSGSAGVAYINGPHTFVSSDSYPVPAALLAHEFAHIFGARDQYASSGCSCTDTGGYFDIETQNCNNASNGICLLNVSSLMRGGWDTIFAYFNNQIDLFAMAQMGLIDTDENNILDPVDILFEDALNTDVSQDNINTIALLDNYYNPSNDKIIGFFTKDYMHKGSKFREGNLNQGDLVKLCHESGRPIVESEFVKLTLIPKLGTPTGNEFITPEVINMQMMYLYP